MSIAFELTRDLLKIKKFRKLSNIKLQREV